MSGIIAFVAGYLVGGMPTADWLATRKGIDLRAGGSGNPGTNNALRLGGRGLALAVLAAELLKGSGVVIAGGWIAGDTGMIGAGFGAVAGNILNPYRNLRGGQGLAIACGVLLTALPAAALVGIVIIAAGVVLLRATAPAALMAMLALAVSAITLPIGPWGVSTRSSAAALGIGVALLVIPKQIRKLRPASPPPLPGPG